MKIITSIISSFKNQIGEFRHTKLKDIIRTRHSDEYDTCDDISILDDLHEEIREVCSQITKTDYWFQSESDSDLIEACIHQRKVLNARYRYLLNKAKESNLQILPYRVN